MEHTELSPAPTEFIIISFAVLKSHDESSDYDMCEPRTTVYMIETENYEPLNEEARDKIYEDFRLQCHCAHDCCGHRNGGVSAIATMWPGRYLITVATSLNY